MDPERRLCDYLLLTALEDEANALERALRAAGASGPVRLRHPGALTTHQWQLAHSLGRLQILTATLPAMGHDAARDNTRGLLQRISPTYVGFLGIAGAADDHTDFGRILVAERIWYYEPAKVRDGGTEHRGPIHKCGDLLVDRLRTTDLDTVSRLSVSSSKWLAPLVGTIASGEKVIASSTIRDELCKSGRDVIGFEMEGHSFADEVEKVMGRERWFMVRAVQDRANASKADDHRAFACDRAAQFVVGFIIDSDLCIPTLSRPEPSPHVLVSSDQSHSDLVLRLAAGLAQASPSVLVETMSEIPLATRTAAIETLIAEAYWRLNDADGCRTAVQRALSNPAWSIASAYGAEAIRLLAWSLWQRNDGSEAMALLKKNFHSVTELQERGRWADLLATITRFSTGVGAFDTALGWYHQSLSLKEASGDYVGRAIAFRQLAMTHAEVLQLDRAAQYFKLLTDFAATETFEGNQISQCAGLVGSAWIDLIIGNRLHREVAVQRLQQAGRALHTLAPSKLSNDLRLALRALNGLYRARAGVHSIRVPQIRDGHWAAVITAQLRVVIGQSVDEALADLLKWSGKRALAPHSLRRLLEAVHTPQTVPPPSVDQYQGCFWPLGAWLDNYQRNALSSIQLLEGIANLYTAIIGTLDPKLRVPELHGIGECASTMRRWCDGNRSSPLGHEVASISVMLNALAPLRNQVVHSTPIRAREVEDNLIEGAMAVLAEASLLRQSHWARSGTAELSIAGVTVGMEPFVRRNSSSSRLEVRAASGSYDEETENVAG